MVMRPAMRVRIIEIVSCAVSERSVHRSIKRSVVGHWHSLARDQGTPVPKSLRKSRRIAGTRIAEESCVAKPKQLIRDALVGFVLGIVVVSGIALVTSRTGDSGAQLR
jgi:hypothetical protein